MQVKLKTCFKCGLQKVIWKNYEGHKYCKECWYSIEKPKRIAPVSKKRDIENTTYLKLKAAFLVVKPKCEANLPGCTHKSIDVHHLYSGANRSKYYLNVGTWKAVCRECHSYIHDELSSEEAIDLGLKLKE